VSRQLEDAITAVRSGHAKDRMCRCPAHEDNQASLHVSPGTEGQPVVLKCHAGCTTEEIIAEAGLDWNEICKPLDQRSNVTPIRIQPTIYSYVDEEGVELYQALRMYQPDGRKTFKQRHLKNGTWQWNLNDVRRVVYRLPDVIAAVRDGKTIWLVEGEKDVQSLNNLDEVATTNPMGAGKWLPEYTETLRGATVHIIADADNPGRKHAREVAAQLREADCTVRTFEAREGKDVTDHLTKGHALEELVETTQDVEGTTPSDGMDILEYVRMQFSAERFVIPDTLAHEERLLVTGLEGHGKSTLLRQIAVQVAAGTHPFTLRPMQPRRVMVIDAENGTRQMQQSWSDLIGRAAHLGTGTGGGLQA
jgi:5S rRNA maturation endonuclease (ribonuclease M5)